MMKGLFRFIDPRFDNHLFSACQAFFAMMIRRTLLPGQSGTKKLQRQYGERLVCVRYRYDAERNVRVTTVELVVEEVPWERQPLKTPKHKIVQVKIAYGERGLGQRVKAAGGTWNPTRRTWDVSYGQAEALGLLDRIVTPEGA